MRLIHARNVDHDSRMRAHRWGVALLCCLVWLLPLAVVACGQTAGARGSGTGAMPSPTLTQKQALLATVAAQETAAANGPHAPKHPQTETPPATCPMPTPQPGIYVPSLPNQGYPDANVDNSTATIPADQPRYEYYILAGDRKSNPRQGLIIVQRMASDPCANPTPDGSVTYYDTPYQQGHVQLTAVVGDSVTFTTANGGGAIHRFDFVTGQFS